MVGMERGRKFKRERIYVYIRLIYFIVQQKLTQHCEAVIFQLYFGFDYLVYLLEMTKLYCSPVWLFWLLFSKPPHSLDPFSTPVCLDHSSASKKILLMRGTGQDQKVKRQKGWGACFQLDPEPAFVGTFYLCFYTSSSAWASSFLGLWGARGGIFPSILVSKECDSHQWLQLSNGSWWAQRTQIVKRSICKPGFILLIQGWISISCSASRMVWCLVSAWIS